MSNKPEAVQFIVSAGANTRLTPNFRAKEYFASDGSLYIHRDLVAGVQLLRDLVGPLSVDSVRPKGIDKGLGVSVKSKDLDQLLVYASRLKREGIFSEVSSLESSSVLLSVNDAARRKSLKPVFAFECALEVVASYETRGNNPYQQISGNFDGAGLSFGIIQFNFKSQTLQSLFELFRMADPDALQMCFGTEDRYNEITRIMTGSTSKAIKWGNSISTGRYLGNVSAPWEKCFHAVGRIEQFKQIQKEFAYDRYGQRLMATLAFLEGLSDISIRNHRCLTTLFDMCIQQGGHGKASKEIKERVKAENPKDEIALTHITVEERAKKADLPWRADCLSRRLGILYREPQSVTVDEIKAKRVNHKLYLIRDTNVNGIERYLSPQTLRDTD